jgi:hypothetical protein
MQHRRENKVAIAQSLADRLAEEALARSNRHVEASNVGAGGAIVHQSCA